MKSMIVITAATLAVATISPAFAKVSCEELKAKIEAKLESKGVRKYTLTIVLKDEQTDLRVVGTCDGDTKKITYERGK